MTAQTDGQTTTEAKTHLARSPGSNRSVCRYSSRPSRRVRLASPNEFAATPVSSRCAECDRRYQKTVSAILTELEKTP
jgi:hypothetical protein